MATRKSYLGRPNYLNYHLTQDMITQSDSFSELDESDVWNVSSQSPLSETKKSIPISSRSSAKKKELRTAPPTCGSLPVNVPDWSKILRNDHRESRRRESDEDDDGGVDYDNEDDRIPPHEYLARTRRASFSVHEGIGRTLKGRDLSRVRNAIWKKTGFED